MAPEIVSFLVGASLLLLLATPFALYYEPVRRSRIVLVVVGGLLGVVPTVYASGLVGSEQRRVLRESLGASSDELIAASVLLFLVAILVFTAAANSRRTGSASRVSRFVTATACIALAAVLAGGIVGVGLYLTERLELVAALYSWEGSRAGAVLLLAWSLLTGAGIAAILELIDAGRYATDPAAGAVIGLLIALLGWLLGVLFALPLWMAYAFDYPLPVPYLHWESLIGLIVFALVFGMGYPLLRRFVGLAPAGENETRYPVSNR